VDSGRIQDGQTSNEQKAVKRGFLKQGPHVKEVTDIRSFLVDKVPDALKKASDLHSVEDDEKTPFKSKYRARELLKTLHAQLQSCEERMTQQEDSLNEKWANSLVQVELLLGTNFVETEELSPGEKMLSSALHRMKHDPSKFESEVSSPSNIAVADALTAAV
jgi:ATPase subunit of ABC transporter with duplicated ATPase domains